MRQSEKFNNKIVLITGGASGIGKIMGRLVLERGARLVIWDVDHVALDVAVKELSAIGTVYGFVVDITDQTQISTTASRIQAAVGTVDVLINNAGIIVGKYFHEHSPQDIDKTMQVNALAPMHLAACFLPAMLQQDAGHICNIASSAALISNPKMAVYVASKWSVLGWSDSLRIEMQQLKKNIGVTTVTPYYINTGMFDGVRSRVPILKPEKVAGQIIRAIEKNKVLLSMPWSVHFVRFFQGLLPVSVFDWVVGDVLGIYSTMDHFKGRHSSNNS